MSLFSILYATEPTTLESAAAAAFPGRSWISEANQVDVETSAMHTSIQFRPDKNFDNELFGIEAKLSLYFSLDKLRPAEARRELASAVAEFLRTTAGDVAVQYLDVLVLKRTEGGSLCASGYEDMIPIGIGSWQIIPALPQPD